MNMLLIKILRITFTSSLITLVACSGGGGGGDGGGTETTTTGTTFFNAASTIDSGQFANSATGDFDGDGDEDLVLTYTGTDPGSDNVQPWTGVPIKIFLQNASGVLEDKTSAMITTVPSITLARHIEVADFNGDGADDIYFGNHGLELGDPNTNGSNWYEQDVLLLSNGAGTFSDDAIANMPTISVTNVNGGAASRSWYTHGVDSADIDADGDIDLVINLFWGSVYVLKNDSNGVFTQSSTFAAANMWVQFIKADNNSSPDLYIGDAQTAAKNRIERNDGLGNFTEGTILMPNTLLARAIEEAHVADVNGDGREDLIIGNTDTGFTEHKIQILVSDASANGAYVDETSTRLPNPVTFTNNYNPKFYVRDLNNDGDKDIVIVKKLNISPYTQETGVFINSSYVFTRVSTSTMPSFEPNIVLIDLKGDNQIDVVETNSNGTQVYTAKSLISN